MLELLDFLTGGFLNRCGSKKEEVFDGKEKPENRP